MNDERTCELCGKEIADGVTREVELMQRQGGSYLSDDRYETCLACFGKLSHLFGAKEADDR